MCRLLGVSQRGFYDLQARGPLRRALADAVISELIREIHARSDVTYGMPHIHAEPAEQGTAVGGKGITRLMRRTGQRSVSWRRGYVVTTQRDDKQRQAPDLMRREFKADAADLLWVANMTYLPTWAGFMFLAIVPVVWCRRVLGWSIGERMTADLVLAAVDMTLQQRQFAGVLHHSVQGSSRAWPSGTAAR